MYHYTGCGLNYVYLKNGYNMKKTPYGDGVTIHDIDGLHRAIASDIVENRPELSPDEFRFMRKELGFTQARLGSILDVDQQTVANWEKGNTKLPNMVAIFLRSVFRERINGQPKLEELINRINELDMELRGIKLTLEETESGWKSEKEAA